MITAACLIKIVLTRRLPIMVSDCPRSIETIERNTSVIVVIFIPPAVEPGLPPIIIKTSDRREAEGDMLA